MLSNFKRLVLTVGGLFIAVVAILFHVAQLYLMAAILFLIPLASYWLGRLLMIGLACERALPTSCSQGERAIVTLTVSNVGRLPKFYLLAKDRLPRWVRFAGDQSPLILQLWPGEASQITYYVEPEKRGEYALGPVSVFSTDPLGFYTFAQTLPLTSELLVYPQVIPLNHCFLEGAAAQGRQDQEGALVRGGGIDFLGVREYQPGDELRRVHWRTTARTGALAVAEYEQGFASDVWVALDLSRSAYAGTGEGPDSALESAVKIAAALCHYLLSRHYATRLVTPSNVALGETPTSDPSLMPRLLALLARAQADSPITLAGLLEQAGAPTPGTLLVYITPEANDPQFFTVAAGYEAQRGRVYGFALDADSFRNGSRRTAATGGPGIVKTVRRGDNLKEVMEGLSNG